MYLYLCVCVCVCVSPVCYRSCSQSVGVCSFQRSLFLLLKNHLLEFLFYQGTGYRTCKSITQKSYKQHYNDSLLNHKRRSKESQNMKNQPLQCVLAGHNQWLIVKYISKATETILWHGWFISVWYRSLDVWHYVCCRLCVCLYICENGCTHRWQKVLGVIKSILTQWLYVPKPRAIFNSTVVAPLVRLYLALSFQSGVTLFNKHLF